LFKERKAGVLRGAILTLLILGCLPAAAQAAETVSLHTSFTPDELGKSTTVGFGFTIASTTGGLPSPLTHVDLRMPAGMSYLTTTLGLSICKPEALVAQGLSGCSPNSRLGYGSAYVEVPFGQGAGREIPDITALVGPPHNGNTVVLFYANGIVPVYAQIVFQGELLPSSGAFGGNLDTAIPLIPSVTNGPPVSIISVNSTIGPERLTYYKYVHGKKVGYRPEGISLPLTCPHGGFPFSAEFAFLDGTTDTASSTVPCPPPVHHAAHHKK
jgi:hypothetical protein